MMSDDRIFFVLPFALPSLNARDRMHWAARGRQKEQIRLEVMAAIGWPRYFPRPPWQRVRVTVWRHSAGLLDPDGLPATCKGLLDVLCKRSKQHPTGLGIIEDDGPTRLELVVRQAKARREAQSTHVLIERLDAQAVTAPSDLFGKAAA